MYGHYFFCTPETNIIKGKEILKKEVKGLEKNILKGEKEFLKLTIPSKKKNWK